MPCQAKTIQSLVEDWNSNLEKRKEVAFEHNADLVKQVEAGELTATAAVKGLMEVPEFLPPPPESWCKWFRKKSGWSLLSRSMENAQWLPCDHPDMVASRQFVQDMLADGEVHPALILNVDQVWRRAHDNRFRFMYKEREKIGLYRKRVKVKRTVDKKAHFIGGSRRSVTAPCS